MDSNISNADLLLLLDIIGECASLTKPVNAAALTHKLSNILPYDKAVYALANLDGNGTLLSYQVLNISYPQEWLDLYASKGFHAVDPIAKENFNTFQPQFWHETYRKWEYPKEFIETAKDFNLETGYACGVRNLRATEGSIFSMSGQFVDHSRHKFILEALAPHLHLGFNSLLSQGASTPARFVSTVLSIREKEILNWIKKGKTSWDISVILAISERTVKFHVNSIMAKLDAVSRTHAVAIALSAGLIEVA